MINLIDTFNSQVSISTKIYFSYRYPPKTQHSDYGLPSFAYFNYSSTPLI